MVLAGASIALTNAQVVTLSAAAQTVGPTTLTIPNFAGISDTFAFVTLAQTREFPTAQPYKPYNRVIAQKYSVGRVFCAGETLNPPAWQWLQQDVLGDRLVRQRKASKKLDNFISEVTSLSTGDIVVHVEHGIGRFVGLQTLEVGGAPHDCVELHYANDTKLFLPVENIELLTRYGGEDAEAQLDKLGGVGWQTRKAKMKKRIREMAHELIRIAAARQLREAPRLIPPDGLYDEFCARFPYVETDDQLRAIGDTIDDPACGTAGFLIDVVDYLLAKYSEKPLEMPARLAPSMSIGTANSGPK